MSPHSRRISLLGEPHLTTVKSTASLAKRIPAPSHLGSGDFKAPTALRDFAVETHENRLIHSPLCFRENSQTGKVAFCFSKMKLDSFAPNFYFDRSANQSLNRTRKERRAGELNR